MAEITRDEATALRETPLGEDGLTAQHAAPLGGLEQARLLFRSGANELILRGATGFADLYQATFEGPVPKVRLRQGIVVVQYQGRGLPWDWRKRNADLTLNASIPWDVEINGGANKLQGDLERIGIRSFELTGGVDRFRLGLGQPGGDVKVRVNGGVNQFRIERPAGVPVQLRVSGGAGGVELDRQRLGAVGGSTVLESAGASKATDRYTIEITGGASRIVIREADGS
jgi:hypothetical protein